MIGDALGDARTVVNVGAGARSYEFAGREVTPVEPSAAMRAQRSPELPRAIDAVAERLPFTDGALDAAMTTFTVHQRSDPAAGLREMRRVARGPVLVLTCDPDRVRDFWLYAYAPEVLDAEARRYPPTAALAAALGGRTTVRPVPIPADRTDGFNETYYARPELLLDPGARQACSAWSFVDDDAVPARFDAHLRRDLADGAREERYGHLRGRPVHQGSPVLLANLP
ncbi:class I SAM-dependent methyltransferase [Actinacidiphila sp. ITFR-21]|uniref:class I SAM-dependent methyltransferase n=1 Tax=Actinacidiphila sp. ITFR-21 TaxID=3075199 RepID=UPI002889896D|nr:methyltransferase domain-containing protein [Streptomyces sp. ITFR-21]WNI16479.1 methyltransferase domain-containing protein [Streptomyces sp. ITFR-21]